MQIDWGEATVYLDSMKKTVNLFCARLCYSDAPIVLAYRRQNEESFLDALVQVFQYFGGVPKRVIFDNGKVAVKDGFGAHARKQAGYAALSAHYGFEAVFCNPASGNEKGLVEGLVGYIRRNVCVPIPKVDTIEELNRMFREKCQQYLSHQIRGKESSVGKMLMQERDKLYPLPRYPFDPCKRVTGRVDRFCTVRFDTNNYSVPAAYCGRRYPSEPARKRSPFTLGDSVFPGTGGVWKESRASITWNTISRCWRKRAEPSFTPDRYRETLPAYFLDWLQRQELSPKELVALLSRCGEESCEDIMMEAPCHIAHDQIEDTVAVQAVDLHNYDAFLTGKAGAAV